MTTKKSSKKEEQSAPTISPAVLTPEMLEAQLAFLEEHDLSLCFDLRLLDKDGEVFQIKGQNSFPHAMREESKPVIPKQFQDVIQNSLLQPLLQRFNSHIQENVINQLPPPPHGSMLDGEPSTGLLLENATEEDAREDSQPDSSVLPE